jgi:putative ABC transport system permease protein
MSIQIKPIVTALSRHKAGTVLIALQIALTLAIVCNALFVIRERTALMARPTGVVENELLQVTNHWVGKPDGDDSLLRTDLATLRALPGVRDAYATNAFPLIGSGWGSGIRTDPEKPGQLGVASLYFVDEHAVPTLGLHLIAGRNFRSDEVGLLEDNGRPDNSSIIVTKTFADKAFPKGDALGKVFYIGNLGAKPSTIIGIVDNLQAPSASSSDAATSQYTILVPKQLAGSYNHYVVRAQPGQLETLLHTVPAALKKVTNRRVIPEKYGVLSFPELRQLAYRGDRGLAILMGGICIVLLIITAAGIVGLSSFWVGQRRKQIGVRRALGATQRDILEYFLTENLLIGIAGVAIGAVLAEILNVWMMTAFEVGRLSNSYLIAGVIALLALGQGAVLAPAMRASRVPPVEATRTV